MAEKSIIPPVLNFWAGMLIVLTIILIASGLTWLLF